MRTIKRVLYNTQGNFQRNSRRYKKNNGYYWFI